MGTDNSIRRIADYLLLYSSHMPEVGLFHGKLGVAVALYMYSHRYSDELMGEYAWELFQQVYDGVHDAMPVGLDSGLAGIGYGTTLLRKYELIDGDLNDTLSDIDSKIMQHDPRRMTDMTTRLGAKGLWLYIKLRESIGEPIMTFDPSYLSELRDTMAAHHVEEPSKELIDLIFAPTFEAEDYIDKPMGIDGGSSYYLIKTFTG